MKQTALQHDAAWKARLQGYKNREQFLKDEASIYKFTSVLLFIALVITLYVAAG